MTKKEARQYAFKKLNNISLEKRLKREEEIVNLLSNNKEFIEAKKVAIYYPLNHEINLLKLRELYPDKKYYFPKAKATEMDFRKVVSLDELISGKFNLKEPSLNAEIEVNIDVYLVPCLATFNNYRLGHGAGYYDRYFKRVKGYKIGIVFKELKDLNIEIGNHDVPMDIIL